MRTGLLIICGVLATTLIAPALLTSAPVDEDRFALSGVIPSDVFLYAGERSNPEREFLGKYWGEVFEALGKSGVADDVMGLVGSLMGAEQTAEVERIKERMSQVLAGINWDELCGTENAFAERFAPLTELPNGGPPILVANMVWLARGSADGAARNFEGLVAILDTITEEANNLAGSEILTVKKFERLGAKVASVDMLASVVGAPQLPISVALRDDLVVIALREQLFDDVLEMIGGKSSKKALRDEPRFKAAFADLPPAEDLVTFFDMQGLLGPIRDFIDTLIGEVSGTKDVTKHTSMSPEARELHGQALSAYRSGDFKQALALTRKAHDASPKNSTNLYNMACFSALVGDRDDALTWLERAVEGGFYAPRKIASDSDLKSLRGDPRFKAALARAGELAAECCVEDVAINAATTGEVFRLRMHVRQAHEEKDYERGLKLIEQAYAVAPNDSMVLYILACFHNLLGHEDRALDFLEQSVDAGFYCPRHMSEDSDLDSIRSHKRYEAALAKAQKKAAEVAANNERNKVGVIKKLVDRLADAAGVFEYTATVESTDGYSIQTETVSVLASDAKSRPIYPVFGKHPQLTDFDRYLPKETRSFSVSGGFDIGELYKFLEDSVRLAGQKGEEVLTKWAGIQEKLGVNLRKDVIGWIGGDSISVTMDDGGWVWMIKVTNGEVAHEKIAAAIQFLATKLPEAAAKDPSLMGLAMLNVRSAPLEHERLQGFSSIYIGMSPQPIVWGIADSYLIFGGSAQAVDRCLATARGEHPSIRDNARAMSEAIVPSGPFTSVSLTDRRRLGEELAAGFQGASMGIGMMAAFIPKPEIKPVLAKVSSMLGKLAPVVGKIDFYKSAACYTTFDGQVWRNRCVTHYLSPAERSPAPSAAEPGRE